MYNYNITLNIEESVHDQWMQWMQETHIADVLATGKFSKAIMCKVMGEEEKGSLTYTVEYTTKDKATLDLYFKEDAERLRNDIHTQFGGKLVATRKELEVVSEH